MKISTPRMMAALDRQVKAAETKEEVKATRMETEVRIERHKLAITNEKERAVLTDIRSTQEQTSQAGYRLRIEQEKTRAISHDLVGAQHQTTTSADNANYAATNQRLNRMRLIESAKSQALDIAATIGDSKYKEKEIARHTGKIPSLPRF